MKRNEVEAEILCLSGDILSGTATKDSIKRVANLAKENNCLDILKRELADVRNTLLKM